MGSLIRRQQVQAGQARCIAGGLAPGVVKNRPERRSRRRRCRCQKLAFRDGGAAMAQDPRRADLHGRLHAGPRWTGSACAPAACAATKSWERLRAPAMSARPRSMKSLLAGATVPTRPLRRASGGPDGQHGARRPRRSAARPTWSSSARPLGGGSGIPDRRCFTAATSRCVVLESVRYHGNPALGGRSGDWRLGKSSKSRHVMYCREVVPAEAGRPLKISREVPYCPRLLTAPTDYSRAAAQ